MAIENSCITKYVYQVLNKIIKSNQIKFKLLIDSNQLFFFESDLDSKIELTVDCLCLSGRVHHAIGNYRQAVQYLQQGLHIAEQLNHKEDEAKIRHRLGLSLWGHGDMEEAQQQLYRATDLFENIRRELQTSSDYKLSLFDLQTASYQALQVNWN